MSTNSRIEDLPDFPILQQISSALWGTATTRGAAVMVGAGFSRNAILPAPNSPRAPLWPDFQNVMKDRLYPNGGNAPSDALRLAEEYGALLGRPALDTLICDLVRDKDWLPGPLHHKLVSLPWADILTTNWDTLLERAADTNVQQKYETVRAVSDIPRMRAPRIVKLHGSLPSTSGFIFTEEDYRAFPDKFAPLVNLVRQVLMENELCLVGFSGDDPNFLQWSGWVRDELGSSARRIYLIGVLSLSPGRRLVLERRGVSPVDLAPLVVDVEELEKQSVASERFLDFLISSAPKPATEWRSDMRSNLPLMLSNRTLDTASLAAELKRMTAIWRSEHEAYPGWLVCPSTDRRHLQLECASNEDLVRRAIETVLEPDRAESLYEVAWRSDLAFVPLSPWLRGVLSAAVKQDTSSLNRRQRCEIGAILARTAREERDANSLEQWIVFLQDHASTDKDVLATCAYEKSLFARDQLDFSSLSKLILTITGEDPIWKVRCAALYYDLGESEKAKQLAIEAVQEAKCRRAFENVEI